MPNIASVLKSEIARLARKEIKQHADSLRHAATASRRDIASLKRRIQDLEGQVRRLQTGNAKPRAESVTDAGASNQRFSAKGLVSLRKRLGLSAADFGLLVGAAALTIYKWEQGKAYPRANSLAALVAVRGIGKKEAAERIAAARPQ